MQERNSLLREEIALSIGASDLLSDPRFPDHSEHCFEIARQLLARHSPTPFRELARGDEGRMVWQWRHAAMHVVSLLVRRGVLS